MIGKFSHLNTDISIHSPHARGDVNCRQRVARHGLFQSTPLMRGETPLIGSEKVALKFQSTPLMRGETILRPELHAHDCISIHSPHARGDAPGVLLLRRFIKISIHSPHARGDHLARLSRCTHGNFNPLPSCEGRLTAFRLSRQVQAISIHSPHARGDNTRN